MRRRAAASGGPRLARSPAAPAGCTGGRGSRRPCRPVKGSSLVSRRSAVSTTVASKPPRRCHAGAVSLLGCAAARHDQSARRLLGRGGVAGVPGLVVAQCVDGRDDRSGTGGQDLPPWPPALRQPRSRHIGLPLPFPLSFDRTSSECFDADRLPPSFSGRPLENLPMASQGAVPGGRGVASLGSFLGHVLSFGRPRSPDLAGARPPCQTCSMNSLIIHSRSKSMNGCSKISGIECASARGCRELSGS
jgi:hypothetical protein